MLRLTYGWSSVVGVWPWGASFIAAMFVIALAYAPDHRFMLPAERGKVRGGVEPYEDYRGPGYCETVSGTWNCNQPDTVCATGTTHCEEIQLEGDFCYDSRQFFNPTRCVANSYSSHNCQNDFKDYSPPNPPLALLDLTFRTSRA